ncbi:hypothetical protein GCM10011391_34060 [Pullulanibacillus camelliae]|uniref:Uncharacterized protein n=1 Tax=Pullulanibacillus camelliae TaxID=1707096 RepID=A0A8J2YL25_9BACL|nr:hypothetical protein [Pullulanibacillus camelliae]GGE52378.1 hypothetical protein GCM10011391_34060 [Pullulanibacillus camelliae]
MIQWKRGSRREIANLSIWGTSYIHPRNPYIVALWSTTFPGYGHLLLHKYIRGFALIIWEIFINQSSHLNLAMVYSFTGHIEAAKHVLDVNYVYMYIPLYLFAIWDSYRTTVELNNLYQLIETEKPSVNAFTIKPLENNYLDKRNPFMAILWSATVPSVGQLYLNQIISAFFTLVVTVIFVHYSHFIEGIHYILQGNIPKSTAVMDKQWLLYMPSLYLFNIFETYMNVIENNKLFKTEQRLFLKRAYQTKNLKIKGNKVTGNANRSNF